MRLEAVPEVRAAVAHELHLPLVFAVAGDELDPVVGKGEFLRDSVTGTSPVVPVAVAIREPCIPGIESPLAPFLQPGLLEPRPFPPRRFRGKQGKRGGDLVVRHGRNGGFVEHKKIPSDRWEASWGKGYRQTTRPGPLPNRLLLFGGKIIHHLLVYLDFWYSRLFYLIKLIEK